MSDYEAEARYEHATTLLDWAPSSSESPRIDPPNDEPGWMILSQTPAVLLNGGCLHRFLLTWRRRLSRPKPAKVPAVKRGKGRGDPTPAPPPAAVDDDDDDGPGMPAELRRR